MAKDIKVPIEKVAWGKFIICGEDHSEDGEVIGAGKDIRLIGKTVSKWRERKGHRLEPGMITGVYDQGIEVLIIGTGFSQALKCPKEVVRSIHDRGIAEVIVEATPKACEEYNRLYGKGRRVALLAHGTC